MNINLNSKIQSIIFYSIPFFISFFIMAVVIIYPHYGLFSDAGQIIDYPKNFINSFPDSISTLMPLEDGRWNPIFHLVSIFIYYIFPDSSRAFYFIQFLFLSVELYVLLFIIYKFTNNKLLSLLALFMYVFSSSFFENFYTLDKVEPRITFFMSLIFLSLVMKIFNTNNKSFTVFLVFQSFLYSLMMFSKETSIFLIASTMVSFFYLYFIGNNSHLINIFKKVFIVQLSVVVLYIGLFKYLSFKMSYRYVKYDIDFSLIIKNILYYLLTSPEFLILLIIILVYLIRFTKKLIKKDTLSNIESFQLLLIFSFLAYFSGICLWRWPLDYYLLPAHFLMSLIVPLFLYENINSILRVKRINILIILIFIFWMILIVNRISIGISIYHLDALKDKLAFMLSENQYKDRRFILPLTSPSSAEIGERIKYFTNVNKQDESKINLYNFWEKPFFNRENTARFNNEPGVSPTKEQLKYLVTSKNNFIIWKFAETNLMVERNIDFDSIWSSSFLKKGDLILVSYGNLKKTSNTRGLSLHQKTIDSFLNEMPIKLRKIDFVENNMFFMNMGWAIFEVESDLLDSVIKYDEYNLKKLNYDSDEILNNVKDAKLLFGFGWHGVEKQNSSKFRWSDKNSELVLYNLPLGKYRIIIDLEPLRQGDEIKIINNNSLIYKSDLHTKDTIIFNFDSTGEKVQILDIQLKLLNKIINDPRNLGIRVFSLKVENL